MSLGPFPFQYRPLRSPTEIRIVNLRRGSGADPVECVLLHKELHERPYQALSYEWGLPSDDDPIITVDGFPARVRTNLHEALMSVRLPAEDVYMWIDALCINQRDPHERGHQVNMMDKIYSGAENVIVWLGQAKDDSDFAMETFAEKEKLLQFIEKNIFQMSECQALIALSHRSYWSRVWVLQEIYLARAYVVRCGCKSISDTNLRDALAIFSRYEGAYDYCKEICKSTLNQHRMAKQFQKHAPQFNTLGRWLRVCITRDLQSSQPRDLIYALLGISYDCKNGAIAPNYDKPLLVVYLEVVRFWLQSADFKKKLTTRRDTKIFLYKLAIKLGLDDNEDLGRLISESIAVYGAGNQ
jgi:hypothetical protein